MEVTPTIILIEEGQAAEVVCTTHGDGEFDVEWSGPVTSVGGDKVEIRDSGDYVCTATSGEDSGEMVDSGSVTVHSVGS